MAVTTLAHSTQTLNPRFSEKTEKARFLRAVRFPPFSQKVSLSGSQ
jgi:hypothetical protein